MPWRGTGENVHLYGINCNVIRPEGQAGNASIGRGNILERSRFVRLAGCRIEGLVVRPDLPADPFLSAHEHARRLRQAAQSGDELRHEDDRRLSGARGLFLNKLRKGWQRRMEQRAIRDDQAHRLFPPSAFRSEKLPDGGRPAVALRGDVEIRTGDCLADPRAWVAQAFRELGEGIGRFSAEGSEDACRPNAQSSEFPIGYDRCEIRSRFACPVAESFGEIEAGTHQAEILAPHHLADHRYSPGAESGKTVEGAARLSRLEQVVDVLNEGNGIRVQLLRCRCLSALGNRHRVGIKATTLRMRRSPAEANEGDGQHDPRNPMFQPESHAESIPQEAYLPSPIGQAFWENYCQVWKLTPLYGIFPYRPRTTQHIQEETMKNVELTVEGHILTIKVDLNKEFGKSSSGKSLIIATTEGNYALPGRDEKVGLNVYRKTSN